MVVSISILMKLGLPSTLLRCPRAKLAIWFAALLHDSPPMLFANRTSIHCKAKIMPISTSLTVTLISKGFPCTFVFFPRPDCREFSSLRASKGGLFPTALTIENWVVLKYYFLMIVIQIDRQWPVAQARDHGPYRFRGQFAKGKSFYFIFFNSVSMACWNPWRLRWLSSFPLT